MALTFVEKPLNSSKVCAPVDSKSKISGFKGWGFFLVVSGMAPQLL